VGEKKEIYRDVRFFHVAIQLAAKIQPDHHHQHINTWLFCRPDTLPVAQSTVWKWSQ